MYFILDFKSTKFEVVGLRHTHGFAGSKSSIAQEGNENGTSIKSRRS